MTRRLQLLREQGRTRVAVEVLTLLFDSTEGR